MVSDHYPILIRLITELNIIRPIDIAKSVISLLMHDPKIHNLLIEKTDFSSLQDATDVIESLKNTLFIIYQNKPNAYLKFESYLLI